MTVGELMHHLSGYEDESEVDFILAEDISGEIFCESIRIRPAPPEFAELNEYSTKH